MSWRRVTFDGSSIRRNWFPGHMRAGFDNIQQKMGDIHLFIEVRDSRLPIFSRNHLFDEKFRGVPRIIIYNKTDLTADCWSADTKERLKEWDKPNPVLFMNKFDKSGRILHRLVINSLRDQIRLTGANCMVLGMPNVGKSFILNQLARASIKRRASRSVVAIGDTPGITKKISSRLKINLDPLIYVFDSPGLLIPRVDSAETFLQLSLINAIKESLQDPVVSADYCLYMHNRFEQFQYVDTWGLKYPCDDWQTVMHSIALRDGILDINGETDLIQASIKFLHYYRKGKLGKFLLEPVTDERLALWEVKNNST